MLHVVLPLFIVSLIAFLDRVNIAYAGLTIRRRNLPWLTPEVFGMGAGIFFMVMFCLEVPHPRLQLVVIHYALGWRVSCLSWGLVCIS